MRRSSLRAISATAWSEASQPFKVRGIDDATPAARAHRMDGHLMDPVMDTDHAVHDYGADRFADKPPWHFRGVSNRTVARASAASSRRYRCTARSTVRRLTRMPFSVA